MESPPVPARAQQSKAKRRAGRRPKRLRNSLDPPGLLAHILKVALFTTTNCTSITVRLEKGIPKRVQFAQEKPRAGRRQRRRRSPPIRVRRLPERVHQLGHQVLQKSHRHKEATK